MQNNANLRSIHQAFVITGNDNKNWYPGIVDGAIMRAGEVQQALASSNVTIPGAYHGGHPSARFMMVIVDDILNTDFLISPGETNRTPWDEGSALNGDNVSYSMLQTFAANTDYDGVGSPAGKAWQNDINSLTPIVSDRTTATTASGAPGEDEHSSIWNQKQWEGGVVWGDGHTETRTDPTMERVELATTKIEDDHLFDPGRNANSYDGLMDGYNVRMVKRNAVKTVLGGD